MHSSSSRSIKKNDQYFLACCQIHFLDHTYEFIGGDFVFQCFGLFITITSGCRVVENNVFLGQAQQLAARECGVSYTGLAELPQDHNVHFCSRFTIADNAHHNTFGNWMHCTYRYGHACETEKGGWTRRKSKETQGRLQPMLGARTCPRCLVSRASGRNVPTILGISHCCLSIKIIIIPGRG